MKIYFAGSIRGGRKQVAVYNEIIEYLSGLAKILTEHIADPKLTALGEVKLPESVIFKRDRGWVDACDLVVAEVTQPSLGVGYELAYAESKKIPVVCLYHETEGARLSAMIRGNKYFKVIDYSDWEDLKTKLQDVL
jgi:nucleoside 2-deoxyribosyltransferase